MRVLHVDAGAEMRGGQWQCLRLVEGLRPGALLLAPADSPLYRQAAARNLPVEPLSISKLVASARGVDIVHVHDARSHTWAAPLGANRLVVSRRVAFPIGSSAISRWKYRRADRFIAVSECVRGVLIDGGVDPGKIDVVYDGVPLAPEPVTGNRIVSLASTDPRKGADLLREAVRDRFEVLFSDDLESDLRTASLFVYITEAEGLGSAALLAMAHGVPVVASSIGGLPEIITDGVNGILTENHPHAIRAAIVRGLEARDALAAAARTTVAERFTVEHMTQGTRQVYESVLAC